MYCPACGTRAPEGATFCASCGKPLRSGGPPPDARPPGPPPPEGRPPGPAPRTAPAGPRPAVSSYLVPSILVTIFCCLPPGIVAIVYAAQVNTKLDAGDVAGARDASRNAKLWCWIGFALGLAGGLAYLAIFVIGIAAGLEGA